jgi:hypothetical protein
MGIFCWDLNRISSRTFMDGRRPEGRAVAPAQIPAAGAMKIPLPFSFFDR